VLAFICLEKSHITSRIEMESVSGFGWGVLVCFGLDWCIARRLNGNRIHSDAAVAAAAVAGAVAAASK
jgi:hypothetical protein